MGCANFEPRRLAEEMSWLWACLTSDLGGLEDERGRVRLHPACPEPGVVLSPEEHVVLLRDRVQAGYLMLRVCVMECSAARGLTLDEYLVEKGRNLALMAADLGG